MIKLKFNIALTEDCNLTITDTTGFTTDNETGFIEEDAEITPVGDYKLSDGYFLDVLTVNKYNDQPVVVLTGDYIHKNAEDVVPVYANNFTPSLYTLTEDSTFTINRYFIMSEEFYNQEVATDRFLDKLVYYTNGTDVYKVNSGDAVKVSSFDLFMQDQTDSTNLYTKLTFSSTCYIRKCYQYLIQLTLAKGCKDCEVDKYKAQRDLLYMSLQAIQFLQDTGYTTEVQRIIESLNVCGSICRSVISTSNCGCNG